MPRIQISPTKERPMDDSISDIAGADRARRHYSMGRAVMSADVIQFIPRPAPKDRPTDFPTIVFRAPASGEACAEAARRDHARLESQPDQTQCPKP
jgi:hypothetical protein